MYDIELVVFDDAKSGEILFSKAFSENRPNAVVSPGCVSPSEDRQRGVS